MSQYETPVIVDGNNSETIEPQACNVCLVGGNVGAVWNVAVAVAYAVGALVVIKGLGPEC